MSVNRKISNLPQVVGASILDTDILPIVASGVTSNVKISDIRVKLGFNVPAGGRTVTDPATYMANNAVFNVKDFGAYGDNSHNDTTAIQNAINAAATYANANGGAIVRIPQANFLVTDTLTINSHRVHIMGDGKHASTITFNPAAARSLFKFQNAVAANVLYQCSVRRLSVVGSGTQQKVAFDLYDTSEFLLEEITVTTLTGNSGNAGTPSIALRTAGREVLTARVLEFFADRPIHIQNNANAVNSTEATDHFHFTDLYFSTQVASETGILIDAAVAVSNLTFDGYQAWVGGKYGLDYTAGGATGVTGFHAAFHNVRYEQSGDATGYAFRWQPQGCQNLLFINCNFGAASNGSYIRNTARIEYNSCQFAGGAGHVAADWDATCDSILVLNTFFQDLSTVNLGTLVEVFSLPKRNTNSPIPSTVYYANPAVTNQFKVAAINTTNGQIKFPAAQVASTDVNTLDDYEEGTWTPSVGGTATYTTQTGTYTKIGRTVYIRLSLTINVIGTGSTSVISGLPFAAETTTAAQVGFFSALAVSVVSLNAFISGSNITLVGLTAAAASMTNPLAGIGAGTQLQISATYNVP